MPVPLTTTLVLAAGFATSVTLAAPASQPLAPEATPARELTKHPSPPTQDLPQDLHLAPVLLDTATLFAVMRVSEAYLWPNPFSFYQTDQWQNRYKRAFTSPPKFDSSLGFMQWDGDRWAINVLGHGLLGSELYLRPRRCGFGILGSVGVAAAASTLWEYGIEANGVQPSGVDLWYTPLSGLILGEARYQAWRGAQGIENKPLRVFLRGLLDPVGEFTGAVFGSPC